jgi:hypothetical protein
MLHSMYSRASFVAAKTERYCSRNHGRGPCVTEDRGALELYGMSSPRSTAEGGGGDAPVSDACQCAGDSRGPGVKVTGSVARNE